MVTLEKIVDQLPLSSLVHNKNSKDHLRHKLSGPFMQFQNINATQNMIFNELGCLARKV
jgi:hypothetical protein